MHRGCAETDIRSMHAQLSEVESCWLGWAEMRCRSGAKAAGWRVEGLSCQSEIEDAARPSHDGSCLQANLFAVSPRLRLWGRIGQRSSSQLLA